MDPYVVLSNNKNRLNCIDQQLVMLDRSSGDSRTLDVDWDRWPSPCAWTRDGREILVSLSDEGTHPVYAVSVESGSRRRVTSRSRRGQHSQVIVMDERFVCVRSSTLSPPEVWVGSLMDPTQFEQLTTLAGCTSASLEAWAAVSEHAIPAEDGVSVHYRIVRPRDAEGPLPVLFWIHGGPISAWDDQWHWRWNALIAVAAGYAVVLPNPRGSTGFGHEYIKGIWGNVWGESCYRDLIAVVDAVISRPDVDPERLVAMGGSFGGYMTNWMGGQTDRFACLVTHAALFSFSMFYGTTDMPAYWAFMLGCSPYRNAGELNRYSPDHYMDQWTSPTLVIHGEKDYRVPVSEGLALFEALQVHGVESELLVFPDENHWILKPRNIVTWYETVLDFIDRHL